MISLILPYWQRQAAAVAGLESLARHYQGLDLEVVVVDDGSPEPFIAPALPLRLKVVTLPKKTVALSPCVPLNRGVAASSGSVVALSCVEMIHVRPVLGQMLDELLRRDEMTYVSAAVWAPESRAWHVHSSLKRLPLNFCAMLRRSLWDRVGGFDEQYRQGVAFEDGDFLFRLRGAGARFVIRDDLVIHHPRKGAKAQHSLEQHERNRLLYEKRWATATS
jgi:glycosyltransferase involved in cell wall biosynthesis